MLVGTIPFVDERSLDLANKRGLYIGEHHFTLLGTNTYRFPEGVPYSYPFNPDVITKVWGMLVQKQVEQGRRMLWTVGYRGLNDYPFWIDDPSYDTPEKRGALISEVIQKQISIIHNQTEKAGNRKEDAQIFTYLWDEAEELYAQGFLKVPEGVCLVHADDGSGVVTSDPKLIGPGDGIYYHVMMEDVGSRNQLTEMVPPARIFGQLGELAKKKATKLLQINTSDLRAVALTLKAVMKFAWDPNKWLSTTPEKAAKVFIQEWSVEQFGTEVGFQVAEVYQDYFNIPYLVDNSTRYGEQYFSHQIREAAQAVVNYMNKSSSLPTEQATENQKLLQPAETYLARLSQRASALLPSIPAPRANFFRSHCLSQIAIHTYGTQALLAVSTAVLQLAQGQKSAALTAIKNAESLIQNIFGAFRAAEASDRWEGWFQHDELDNFFSVWDVLRQAKALFQSTSCPPKRFWKGGTTSSSTEFNYQTITPDPRAYPFFYLDPRFMIDAVVRVLCAPAQPHCHNSPTGGHFGDAGAYITLSTLSLSPLVIHYTTDGTEVVVSSPTYTSPFKIYTNTTINARAFTADGQPADVVTRSRWQAPSAYRSVIH